MEYIEKTKNGKILFNQKKDFVLFKIWHFLIKKILKI